MCVKQSMFRKAKGNILFITHSMFLVIILLTSGNGFIAFFHTDAKEKNCKMHSVYNIIDRVLIFFLLLERKDQNENVFCDLMIFYFYFFS